MIVRARSASDLSSVAISHLSSFTLHDLSWVSHDPLHTWRELNLYISHSHNNHLAVTPSRRRRCRAPGRSRSRLCRSAAWATILPPRVARRLRWVARRHISKAILTSRYYEWFVYTRVEALTDSPCTFFCRELFRLHFFVSTCIHRILQ